MPAPDPHSCFRPSAEPPEGEQARVAEVTLVFSDVVGFTRMLERLGDQHGYRVMQRHNAIVREQLALHRGEELELQGDGFLLAFASPLDAVLFAMSLQCALALDRAAYPSEPIHVRIGLHTGTALRRPGGYFGRAVVLASRIADLAAGDEILCSEAICQAVQRARLCFAPSRCVPVKGMAEGARVRTLAWAESSDLDSVQASAPERPAPVPAGIGPAELGLESLHGREAAFALATAQA